MYLLLYCCLSALQAKHILRDSSAEVNARYDIAKAVKRRAAADGGFLSGTSVFATAGVQPKQEELRLVHAFSTTFFTETYNGVTNVFVSFRVRLPSHFHSLDPLSHVISLMLFLELSI